MHGPSQRGAVLLVALVMLLLLTIIGLAGMRGANLEERMAGNLREQMISFQASEAALRAGEQESREIFRSMPIGHAAYDARAGVELSGFSYRGELEKGAPDVSSKPTYSLKYLRDINNEGLEVGKGRSAYGAVVQIRATGYGMGESAGGDSVASASLTSIYFLR
ncbi:hypothetical protein D3C76_539230 [compost metagenome]